MIPQMQWCHSTALALFYILKEHSHCHSDSDFNYEINIMKGKGVSLFCTLNIWIDKFYVDDIFIGFQYTYNYCKKKMISDKIMTRR